MSESRFGRLAANDPRLVSTLREGRKVGPPSIADPAAYREHRDRIRGTRCDKVTRRGRDWSYTEFWLRDGLGSELGKGSDLLPAA